MKIYLESYGCTLNHGEARFLKELLTNAGHKFLGTPEQAEIVVLFTCCVIETTELKMIRRARYFSSLGRPMIVSGCMAVVQREALREVHNDIYFLKPKEIMNINDLLDNISEKLGLVAWTKVPGTEFDETYYSKPLISTSGDADSAGELLEEPGESIDYIIPIATGCRGKCTYCITRLARGRLVSYPETQILEQATSAVSTGHYELRLTAQDSACYGYDLQNNLADLLSSVAKIKTKHEFRVRIGMMNPNSVKPIVNELIESYKHPRIFKFLHIPVQSGDDEILKAMNRRYTTAEFFEIIDRFRDNIPELTVSTDLIVGYPNETAEQFRHSLELLERLRPNIVNITRFSARAGTPAAKLKNSLSGSTVKSRSRQMTELRFKISKELNESTVGRKYRILVTEHVKPGSALGRTDNYQPVVVKTPLLLGRWVKVEIVDATDSYLVGKAVR